MSQDNLVWHSHTVTHAERVALKGHQPVIVWFTGLSGSGKSTIANAVERRLLERGCHSYLLDGDNVRHGLNRDLGFNDSDRVENIRRIGEVARLFVDAGNIVLTAFISPFLADRQQVREMVPQGQFIEVFIDTPLEECERRDPKGLYQKARAGEIPHFTGIDSAYEAPLQPEVHVKAGEWSVEACVDHIVAYLEQQGVIAHAL
ncbi:adenylyl-sulfate kinase [Photobacterium rosenbergii]|uniref:adenylyl-sulfate kinase n=1 Tax=Photobacterium rosenbergii TaxID=294936 RepID=UPI001C9928B6|nr:adenylyl-sulfate kinase [Photobacterium rosenbergii]MBY5947399.1 adenylyl-sulfate kinase [Photobacterium rosenbergii]